MATADGGNRDSIQARMISVVSIESESEISSISLSSNVVHLAELQLKPEKMRFVRELFFLKHAKLSHDN
jgi:hypothetical protein